MSDNPRVLEEGDNLTVYSTDDDRVVVVDDYGNKYDLEMPDES